MTWKEIREIDTGYLVTSLFFTMLLNKKITTIKNFYLNDYRTWQETYNLIGSKEPGYLRCKLSMWLLVSWLNSLDLSLFSFFNKWLWGLFLDDSLLCFSVYTYTHKSGGYCLQQKKNFLNILIWILFTNIEIKRCFFDMILFAKFKSTKKYK